jgi:protoporphyrinogen oxidase
MRGRDGRIAVVGAGPAGLACGLALLRDDPSREVTLLERDGAPGGLAGGFERNGLSYDFGSHRIHPSAGAGVMTLLRGLPGLELRERPRNGRILLRGRLVRFPPTPVDALLRLPPGLAAGILADRLRGWGRRRAGVGATFGETVEAGMGRTMARAFYLPYTRKLWGLEASEVSGYQAARRVSSSRGPVARALMGLPLLSRLDPTRRFTYPSGGFATLAAALAAEFTRLGGRLLTGQEVVRLAPARDGPVGITTSAGLEIRAGHVFWSAPLDSFGRSVREASPEAAGAAEELGYRSMVLLYVELPDGPFTRFDAHYLPGPETRFTRLSEPRNYGSDPVRGRSGLCLELPCGPDPAGRDVLLEAASSELGRTPLGFPSVVSDCWTRTLTHAYPVYRMGFERSLETVSGWALSTGRITLLGRQGLFAHDNLHHAMETGLAAASCLSGVFDRDAWRACLERFRSHCVSD